MIGFDRYDVILTAIAASLLGGASLGLATALTVRTGIAAGALVATLLIYEAIYRNPPLPPSDARIRAALVVWHVGLVVLLLDLYFG